MNHVPRTPARLRFRRTLVCALALGLAASTMSSVSTGGAEETGREVVADNRYLTDPDALEPYGLYNAKITPYTGTAFVDRSKGALTFQLFDGLTPPTVTPQLQIGDRFEVHVSLPDALDLTPTTGSCAPLSGSASLYLGSECVTTRHTNGRSTVVVTFTAKRALLTPVQWGIVRSHTVGLTARRGQVAATDSAHVTIDLHDDAFRRSTLEVPFTTAVGVAHDLNVRSAQAHNDHTPGAPSPFVFWSGDQGHISFGTGLDDPAGEGVSMKTGETFTYTVTIPQNSDGGTGGIVYNPSPHPGNPITNACARAVDGYDIRCEAVGGTVRLITTRTGPDVVNDRPIEGRAYIPVVNTYTKTRVQPTQVNAHVNLTSTMQQGGAEAPAIGVAELMLWGVPRSALGIHNLTVTPYVGTAFAESGRGRVAFDFFPDSIPTPTTSYIFAGDVLTVKLSLGPSLVPSDAVSGSAQGDRSRNWCDGVESWDDDLAGYLSTPACTTTMDPTTGDTTVTVTAKALQRVPSDRLGSGFQLRVDGTVGLTDGTQIVTAELSSTRPGMVSAGHRRSGVEIRTMTTDAEHSSSLGVWSQEAHLGPVDPADPAWQEGWIGWRPDPLPDEPDDEEFPLMIETGDVIRYRIDLPTGLEYLAVPSAGTTDVCALPHRYDGFDAACVISTSSVEYVLTRTGPGHRAFYLDPELPFSIPVIATADDVTGDVVITLETTIDQSGSDRRRGVAPIQAIEATVPAPAATAAPVAPVEDAPVKDSPVKDSPVKDSPVEERPAERLQPASGEPTETPATRTSPPGRNARPRTRSEVLG